MAIYTSASDSFLRRNTATPTMSAYTSCVWIRRISIVGSYDTALTLELNGGESLIWQLETSSLRPLIWNSGPNGTYIGTQTIPANEWFFAAHTCDGTTHTGYYGLRLDQKMDVATQSSLVTSSTDRLVLGNDQYVEGGNWELASWKVWDRVLTAAELEDERRFYLPLNTHKLHLWAPLLSANAGDEYRYDYSGNAKFLAIGGSHSSVQDVPPIGWAPKNRDFFDFSIAAAPSVARMILVT